MSAFGNVSLLDLQRIWDGVHGRVVHGDRITLGVIELDPNSLVPSHGHENEQVGICLSGLARVPRGRRVTGPRRGETWTIPANVPHEVHVGPEGAVVIDVFVPRATTGARRSASRRALRAGPSDGAKLPSTVGDPLAGVGRPYGRSPHGL